LEDVVIEIYAAASMAGTNTLPASTSLTDKSGAFQTPHLAPGKYRVRCLDLKGAVVPGGETLVTVSGDAAPAAVAFQIPRPPTGVTAQDGVWRYYTRFDGLASGAGGGLKFDRQGNLWISGDGLTRFDGGNISHLHHARWPAEEQCRNPVGG